MALEASNIFSHSKDKQYIRVVFSYIISSKLKLVFSKIANYFA